MNEMGKYACSWLISAKKRGLSQSNKKIFESSTAISESQVKMKRNSTSLKIGDSVKVKEGTKCPDSKDLCIGGWQGRLSEIGEDDDGNDLIRIRWDSITLKNMPRYFIDQSEEAGLEYAGMYLWPEDVELVECRDTEEDVAKTPAESSKGHSWSWLGEEGKRIQRVLADVDEDNVM